MAYKFACSSCGTEVIVRFLRPTDPYKCKCGGVTAVPVTAEFVEETSNESAPLSINDGLEILPPGPIEPTAPPKPLVGGAGVFTLIAFAANAAMVFFQFLGLTMLDLSIMHLVWTVLIAGTCGLSVFALTRKGEDWEGVAQAVNIILFILIGLMNVFIAKTTEIRVGGIMFIVVGIINVAAFKLRDKMGFLGLYFQRKRLEEAKRIAELDRDLSPPKS